MCCNLCPTEQTNVNQEELQHLWEEWSLHGKDTYLFQPHSTPHTNTHTL